MSRSASGYGFKEHVAGFRNELKVLDAFLAQIRRLSWCHRSWHVAHERDAPLFAGSSDCKIALSRQAIVYLDEMNEWKRMETFSWRVFVAAWMRWLVTIGCGTRLLCIRISCPYSAASWALARQLFPYRIVAA